MDPLKPWNARNASLRTWVVDRWGKRMTRPHGLSTCREKARAAQRPDSMEKLALLSVSDKRGLVDFATGLVKQHGYRLLSTGRYVTVLPDSVLRYNAKQWALKALPIDLGMKPMSITLITLKNRTVSPVVQRFVEQVRAVAKRVAP